MPATGTEDLSRALENLKEWTEIDFSNMQEEKQTSEKKMVKICSFKQMIMSRNIDICPNVDMNFTDLGNKVG